MDNKDYYKIMGLSREATPAEIKQAYRRLARKYHPDLSKEAHAEEKFKEMGEAYEILKDPKKRVEYDQYGSQGPAGATDHESSFQWGNASGSPFDEDIMDALFGARGGHKKRHGADVHAQLTLPLEEAYHGAVKELKLSGHAGHRTLRVKIPANVKNGQKIRLEGQGEPSHAGMKAGDLYITLHIEKHPVFDVVNQDVYVTLPVTPWEVALGCTVTVPTLAGSVELKIPPGSQGGQTLRLKKRGLQGAVPGDQYIVLKIVIPQPRNEEDRALYQKMAETMSFNPRHEEKKHG